MTQNEIIKNFEIITDDNFVNGINGKELDTKDVVNVTVYVFDDDYDHDFYIGKIIGNY